MHRTQAYGTVHMSTNGGISWTPAGASLLASGSTTGCDTDNVGGCDFSGVVSSGDGSTLVAFAGGEGGTEDGYSYTSHDSGATWTRGDTKKVWSVFSFQMSCAIDRARRRRHRQNICDDARASPPPPPQHVLISRAR